jgi:GNAT superfamily N-acetyltransferase
VTSSGHPAASTEIVPFEDAHAEAFYALNRAWLDAHGLYEPADEKQLADPRGRILARGGDVFVALLAGRVVGTAALIPLGAGVVEIAKLAVAENVRGGGLGRRLVEWCIARAREQGMRRIVLVSSTRLGPALRLYESLGFLHRPPPAPLAYETADVYMELELGAAPPAG